MERNDSTSVRSTGKEVWTLPTKNNIETINNANK